jgi:hypothetical protein
MVVARQLRGHLRTEIAELKHNIDRHRGVGAYYDLCKRWQFYIDAYERLHEKLCQTPF